MTLHLGSSQTKNTDYIRYVFLAPRKSISYFGRHIRIESTLSKYIMGKASSYVRWRRRRREEDDEGAARHAAVAAIVLAVHVVRQEKGQSWAYRAAAVNELGIQKEESQEQTALHAALQV